MYTWWGMITEGGKKQLEAVLTKAIRQGFLPPDHPRFSEICEGADQRLCRSILQNPDHVLHQRLPPVKPQSYNLREWPHDRVIPQCKKSIIPEFIYYSKPWFIKIWIIWQSIKGENCFKSCLSKNASAPRDTWKLAAGHMPIGLIRNILLIFV